MSSIVQVHSVRYDGVSITEKQFSYEDDKTTHLVPKLGRRCGKHHAASKAHCVENAVIARENRREARQQRCQLRQSRNPVLTLEQAAKLGYEW